MLANLRSLDQVVVGLIDGYCLGGGVQLAIGVGDIRVASERAVFAIPRPRAKSAFSAVWLPGICLGWLGLVELRHCCSVAQCSTLKQAASWGLIDQVVARSAGCPPRGNRSLPPLNADSLASVAACKQRDRDGPRRRLPDRVR